ncbi:RuvA C-terminal domain-containing protein [Oerskovia sp. M15]
MDDQRDQVVQALVGLGWNPKAAEDAVATVLSQAASAPWPRTRSRAPCAPPCASWAAPWLTSTGSGTTTATSPSPPSGS